MIFLSYLMIFLGFLSTSRGRNTFLCKEQNIPDAIDACTLLTSYACGVKFFIESEDANQTLQSYANGCYACFNKDVSFYQEVLCEIYPKNVRLCHPQIEQTAFCKEDRIEPVCGYFQLLQSQELSGPTSFKNACEACKISSLEYYLPGRCNGDIRE